jgi:deoxyadenosine/deoxycytidine kinase
VRGRSEETNVSLDYLKSLHDRHEDWFIHKKPGLKISKRIHNIPVLVLDCDEDFLTSKERREEMLDEINNFLIKL